MPCWDFQCPMCGHRQTGLFRNVEEAERFGVWCQRHGLSGDTRMIREQAAPNFVLKGAGWTPKHYGDK